MAGKRRCKVCSHLIRWTHHGLAARSLEMCWGCVDCAAGDVLQLGAAEASDLARLVFDAARPELRSLRP